MTKVSVSKTINVSAKQAWKELAAFGGIENFSPIERSETKGRGVGMKRTCYMPDTLAINEELTILDEDGMHLEYVIHSGPFPVTDYTGIIRVKSTGDNSCEVSWGAHYKVDTTNEEKMKNMLEGFYNVSIEGLASYIRGRN